MQENQVTTKPLLVSAVLPCLNEEKHIRSVLEFYVNAAPAEKELIIADGGSGDRTRQIIHEYSDKHPDIILIDNPERYVPFALNKCLERAKGEYIVRLDAHTQYSPDYFTRIIAAFDRTGAGIVGGPMRAKGNTAFQRAVGVCTSTAFGVGDSRFHDESNEGFTDSVYLGAWRKEIFERTGFFDEEMFRNQDDEFHYRAGEKGIKIYLDPEIKSWYYPRSGFRSLMKQYFQYGLFKPLVLSKVRSGIKLRHLIPSAFTLYLFTLPIGIVYGIWYLIPLLLYIALNILFSFSRQNTLSEKILSLFIYPALHVSYGTGLLLGLNRRIRNGLFEG